MIGGEELFESLSSSEEKNIIKNAIYNATNKLDTNQKNKIYEISNKIIPLKIKLRGVQWSRTKCCWPEGDPKQNSFKFCGEDIFPGRPYCDKHSLLAYTNTRENS